MDGLWLSEVLVVFPNRSIRICFSIIVLFWGGILPLKKRVSNSSGESHIPFIQHDIPKITGVFRRTALSCWPICLSRILLEIFSTPIVRTLYRGGRIAGGTVYQSCLAKYIRIKFPHRRIKTNRCLL